MLVGATYCGSPPLPETLAGRFNLDPILFAVLLGLAATHWALLSRVGKRDWKPLLGWAIALAALASPLCALSVSLFSARVGQHMILILIAAPMIASSLPQILHLTSKGTAALWSSAVLFFLALWFWHMPVPYAATFSSTPIYWAMHVSLFGSAVWLWSELLGRSFHSAAAALIAGLVSSMQMGLLGAVIALAGYPLYVPHFATTAAWGLSPLEDQQLGGVLMWVPGCVLFLAVAARSFLQLAHGREALRA